MRASLSGADDPRSGPQPRATEAPALADDPDDAAADHGRVGYGRFGRYSPLALGCCWLLVVAGIWWTQRDAAPGTAPLGQLAGEPAPDVTLTLLDGGSLRLADLRGDVVVLNFWASWCAPCRAEMPELQAYWDAARRAGEETTIVGVGIRTDVDQMPAISSRPEVSPIRLAGTRIPISPASVRSRPRSAFPAPTHRRS